jgi:putative ubiquitin-RnfH superfamily antitoxin RatB of RatAB toxin-antitoxin module
MGRADRTIHVEVVFSPAPRTTQQRQLTLPTGSTLGDALRASGLFEAGVPSDLGCGIWGRRQPVSTPLRDGDRVEAYRGLAVDPKEARRLRYKGQPKRKRPARAGRSEV